MLKIIFLFIGVFFVNFAFGEECAKISPLDCLKSSVCSLDCNRTDKDHNKCISGKTPREQYFCREKKGECELKKPQNLIKKKECEANQNCQLQSGGCFCRCDFDDSCDCFCGGGVPPNCESKRQ